MKITTKQYGAVSLFVVIFAALLITIVTVSFIRIMILNQQQSTANDMSQSAYDSAQVGVEDAKRAILSLQVPCSHGDTKACDKLTSSTCNAAVGPDTLPDVITNGSENKVQSSSADSSLNQAYTCVKISMNTADYVEDLKKNAVSVVPLVGVDDFDKIKIEWFNSGDLNGATTDIHFPSNPGTMPLLNQNDWVSATTPNIPSILRAQIIQFNKTSGFSLNELNGVSPAENAYSYTLFLYPQSGGTGVGTFLGDIRPPLGDPGTPSQEPCEISIASGGYACSATLSLPQTVGTTGYVAYLTLQAFYTKTSFKITLLDSTTGKTVYFKGVEPIIDSTGRADNLFRRVQSRVKFDIYFPYPQAAVETTGNLCKSFFVTKTPGDYKVDPPCTP